MIKILFIRSSVGFGGAEVYNLNLLQGVKNLNLNWQASFVINNKLFYQKLKNLGIKTICLNIKIEELGSKKSFLRFLFTSPRFFFKYFQGFFLLRNNFDFVCLQSGTEKIMLTFWLKVFGKKVIWLEHGPVFAFKKFWLVNFLCLLNSRLVDSIITVSHQARKDLIDGGVNKGKIFTVKTGIDAVKFSPLKMEDKKAARQFLGFLEKDFVVGYAGSVCFEKGIKKFITVAQLLLDKNRDFKFIICGDGPQLTWAKKQVEKINCADSFVFTGFVDNIKKSLGVIDLFFFPTDHLEGLSLTLMEAMALEKAVLVKDIGGNRELIIDGKSGYLFKNETVGDLANLIVKIKNDKKATTVIGRLARKRIVDYFNLENWLNNLDKKLTMECK